MLDLEREKNTSRFVVSPSTASAWHPVKRMDKCRLFANCESTWTRPIIIKNHYSLYSIGDTSSSQPVSVDVTPELDNSITCWVPMDWTNNNYTYKQQGGWVRFTHPLLHRLHIFHYVARFHRPMEHCNTAVKGQTLQIWSGHSRIREECVDSMRVAHAWCST